MAGKWNLGLIPQFLVCVLLSLQVYIYYDSSTDILLICMMDTTPPASYEFDHVNANSTEHARKSFSTRKLAMEIRMQRLKTGLSNVPARLFHREQHRVESLENNMLDCLIDDVLIYIGSFFLSRHDLWSLAQVSRRCAALFVPLIYTNINLLLRRIYEVNTKGNGIIKNGNNRETVLLAQKRLLKNLTRHPQYNLRIRTLMWYLDDREMRTNFWDILKPMVNVERLWICSPYGSPFCPDSETYDQYLQTVAKRLTSTTYSSDSSSTLFTEHGGELEVAPCCRQLTFQGIISLPFAKHLMHPSVLESFSIDCTPRWTGPILSHLSSSSTPFSRLASLTLIFPCGNTLSSSLEIDLLKSWHQVLYAFHRSLTHVTIASRLTSPGLYAGPPVAQPSFSLLKTYIFCIFLDGAVILDDKDSTRSGGEPIKWEKLKTLTLRGRSMIDKTGDVFNRLHAIVPELVINSSADKEDTLWHNQFAYNVLLR